jgi:hypothetical protein
MKNSACQLSEPQHVLEEKCDIFPTPEMDPILKDLDIGKTVEIEQFQKLKVCHPFFPGYGYKCFISYAESPSLFFIQLIENADKLQELDGQLK